MTASTYVRPLQVPTAMNCAAYKRMLDTLAEYAPEVAEPLRADLNARYMARTLDALDAQREIRAAESALHNTDAYLTHLAAQTLSGGRPTGTARAARYLLAVPFHARAAVVSDASLCTNMSGGRYADNVECSARRWESCLKAQQDGTNARLARGSYSEPNLPGTGG